jgi:carbonic anhydrase/acetyltransferase-like protein (isoleucine patch superfamily)
VIITYKGRTPKIGLNVYVAPTAVIIGDVTIEDHSSVWFNAVVRGDLAPIHIGQGTNIQDNCTLHTDSGVPLTIGNHVTVGHNAVVHGCTVQSHVLIGSVILNHAIIEEGCIVAANALVKERHHIRHHSLVAGVPAQIKKVLAEYSSDENDGFAAEYIELSVIYRRNEEPKAES